MEMIFLISFTFITLFFLGYGLTALALTNKSNTEKIWLSPWVGVILIAVYTPILSFGRIPMSLGIFIIILLTFAINIYSIFKVHPLLYKRVNFIIPLSALMLILYLFLLDFYGFMEMIRNITENISIKPAEFRVTISQKDHFIGIYSLIDFFMILFKQKFILIANILPHTFLIAFFPLIFILVRRILPSFFLLLILYFFINYYNPSLDKLIFGGVMIFILIIFFDNFPNLKKAKPTLRNITLYDILLAISMFSLSTFYPQWFRIFFVLIIMAVLSTLFLRQNKNVVVFLIKVFFLMIIINPIIISMAFYVK